MRPSEWGLYDDINDFERKRREKPGTWCYRRVDLPLWRQSQEEKEFKAIFGYTVSLRSESGT